LTYSAALTLDEEDPLEPLDPFDPPLEPQAEMSAAIATTASAAYTVRRCIDLSLAGGIG
jgi:hypothetical protein